MIDQEARELWNILKARKEALMSDIQNLDALMAFIDKRCLSPRSNTIANVLAHNSDQEGQQTQ